MNEPMYMYVWSQGMIWFFCFVIYDGNIFSFSPPLAQENTVKLRQSRMFQLATRGEDLQHPAAMFRFNDAVVLIPSGLIGGL